MSNDCMPVSHCLNSVYRATQAVTNDVSETLKPLLISPEVLLSLFLQFLSISL